MPGEWPSYSDPTDIVTGRELATVAFLFEKSFCRCLDTRGAYLSDVPNVACQARICYGR
jgi:hypothetical protein